MSNPTAPNKRELRHSLIAKLISDANGNIVKMAYDLDDLVAAEVNKVLDELAKETVEVHEETDVGVLAKSESFIPLSAMEQVRREWS